MIGFNKILNGRKKPKNLDLRKQAHIQSIPDVRIDGPRPAAYAEPSPRSSKSTSPDDAFSSSSLSVSTPITPTSPATRDFHILASLQMSIKSAISGDAYAVPPNTPMDSEFSSGNLSSKNNPIDMRKQGRLCLTFALRNDIDIPSQDRIKLANELEEHIDKAYLGTDYRSRIYTVGGILSDQPAVVRMLTRGEISAEEVAVAKTTFHPLTTPATPKFTGNLRAPTVTSPTFGKDQPPPSPTVVWCQDVPNSPKFKPE